MVKRLVVIVALVCGSLLLIAVALIVTLILTLEQTCTAATLSNGRSVSTIGKAWQSFSMEASHDTATIKAGSRLIVVAPTRLIVDGKVAAQIAAAAKDVVVSVHGGAVEFIVDGKPPADVPSNSPATH